ncbi:hypothetical protein DM860_013006 [Cuscuta australis]|uniref:Uncharacterized protein n=1 Tax=Cuscuta australis TaxID=267555 RepID=A0A328D242_9ASTE|nr:hypothetical protein DM860_013006 [Cuscuta australis]
MVGFRNYVLSNCTQRKQFLWVNYLGNLQIPGSFKVEKVSQHIKKISLNAAVEFESLPVLVRVLLGITGPNSTHHRQYVRAHKELWLIKLHLFSVTDKELIQRTLCSHKRDIDSENNLEQCIVWLLLY